MKTDPLQAQPHQDHSAQRRQLLAALSVPLVSLTAGRSHAQAPYPSRTIQMVNPFAVGGPGDTMCRLYSAELAKALKQSIVVLNPAGASGTIGGRQVAESVPDGHMILWGTTSTIAIGENVLKNVPYQFKRDFSMIGLIANAPHVLVVRNELPARDVKTFIDMAKQSPGKLTYSSAGPGTIIHMGNELFKHETATDVQHIPYKGGAPATTAVLSGEVDMTVNDMVVLGPLIASGKLRPLAVASTSRLRRLPDLPTFAEAGYPGIISSTWWGIAVPSKTPEEIKSRLREAHEQVMASADFRKRLEDMEVQPLLLRGAQIDDFVQKETEKWKRVIDAAGITAD